MLKEVYLLILVLFLAFPIEGRLYFIHVQKTGGTTLRLLLEMQLSQQEVYPFRNSKTAVRPITENLVSGHLPYWLCQTLDDSFEESFKVTILRDPVERYLSFLRAKKKGDSELRSLESVLKLRKSPSNRYREGMKDNALCRYLTDNTALEGEALLERAKYILDQFDCVIFFDHYIEDVIDLFHRLGIPLNIEDVPRMNTTQSEPISTRVLEEVRRLNELDIQLYEYAKSKQGKKSNQYSLRTSTFEEVLQKTSSVNYTFDLPLNGRGWTYRDEWPEAIEYPTIRWVMDSPAVINFPLEEVGDYVLAFNACPLTDGIIPRVKVNGHEIEIIKKSSETFSLYHGEISAEWITQDSTEIEFSSNKAMEFREVHPMQYNRNYPPLSFALNRIQIQKASFEK